MFIMFAPSSEHMIELHQAQDKTKRVGLLSQNFVVLGELGFVSFQ